MAGARRAGTLQLHRAHPGRGPRPAGDGAGRLPGRAARITQGGALQGRADGRRHRVRGLPAAGVLLRRRGGRAGGGVAGSRPGAGDQALRRAAWRGDGVALVARRPPGGPGRPATGGGRRRLRGLSSDAPGGHGLGQQRLAGLPSLHGAGLAQPRARVPAHREPEVRCFGGAAARLGPPDQGQRLSRRGPGRRCGGVGLVARPWHRIASPAARSRKWQHGAHCWKWRRAGRNRRRQRGARGRKRRR